ncbi:MAG: hypothetical protein P9X24_01295 [Candidatus Hatepunaea meridiana]|nr:hypothetical protein [Candidatus Hatepunaea meridiana]
MKYSYADLSPNQFEDLIVALCHFLLGAGAQGFATGPDGGRDAKFVGTAELIPSKADPWIGTTIVQAKHTNGLNKSFSDPYFFSKDNCDSIILKEISRIKKLRKGGELDNYMLFSNRRLTGLSESNIRSYISVECDIPEQSIQLCDIKQLELWLNQFPDAAKIANVDPLDSPLIVSPEELAEVVEALSDQMSTLKIDLKDVPTDRVSYEEKNIINRMSAEYAKMLRKYYLKETPQIKEFLANPENNDMLEKYNSTVEEFQLKVIAKRSDFQLFDDVMNYLFDFLFNRDPVLGRNRRLTRSVLFYMYWNCDLGENSDA